MSKRETPQWEEVTGNPSSGKDKKTRNNCRPKQDKDLQKPRSEIKRENLGTNRAAGKAVPRNRNKRQAVRESRMKHTRAERQDPDATASTLERRKLQMTRTGKEEPRTRETVRE